MPATWQDFSLVGSASQSGGGSLYISDVQPNDLIVAVSTVYRYGTTSWFNLYPPAHTPAGVTAATILERLTVPFDLVGDNWQFYPHWNEYWLWWQGQWWWNNNYRTLARVSLYKATNNGTLQMMFTPTHPSSPIIQCHVSVWRPQVTVGNNEVLKEITYAQSAQRAQNTLITQGGAQIPVRADELLLVTAKGVNVPQASASLSGVSAQNLLTYLTWTGPCAVYDNVCLWRIKTSGTAVISAPRANMTLCVTKIIPNAVVAHNMPPSVPPDAQYFYVELVCDLISTGRVIRPRWFENIRTQYAWSNSLGLRKRWITDTCDPNNTTARVTELWKVPKGAESMVPSGEAYVFTSDQDAEARVLMHDEGW